MKNHYKTIAVTFRDETGRFLSGELVNPYFLSLADNGTPVLNIEQTIDDCAVVAVYDGEMNTEFHMIDDLRRFVRCDEVLI